MNRLRLLHCHFLVCAMLLAVPADSMAQAVYGSIFGTVTDPAGSVVPNATVIVTDASKNISTTFKTNESGNYTAGHLIPDVYNLRVQATGFGSEEIKGVTVSADTSEKEDVALKVGSAEAQAVVVTAAADQLKTDRADVATVLNSRATETLPNLNRNFTAFELLTPGVTQMTWSHASSENPQGSVQLAVNGQLGFNTDYQLDGTENQDPNLGIIVVNPALDAVAETKVTTTSFDAEFGKATAGIVSAQTKSGSNNFHGSVFEYRRSDAQQARDPFTQYARDPLTGKYIPSNLYNQFGGALGGPILKDRLFFFGDYQGVRQKVGASTFQNVPTALARQTCLDPSQNCNLSDYIQGGQGQLYDPATGDLTTGAGRAPFANNVIPAARISPQARYLLNLVPAPTTTGLVNNYVASGTGSFNTNQFDTRIDDQLRPNIHVLGRYSYFSSKEFGPTALGKAGGAGFGIGGFGGTSDGKNQSLATGADWAISPSLLTDFRFGYFRLVVTTAKYDGSDPLATKAGIPGLNTGDPLAAGAPAFYATRNGGNTFGDGLSSFGSGLNNLNQCNCILNQTEQQFQLVNNWTRSIGNHSIKVGGDWRHAYQLRLEGSPNRAGLLTFDAGNTATSDNANAPGGLGLGTLLLGQVTTFQRYVGNNAGIGVKNVDNAADLQNFFFLYAQDNWRLTHKLTVNYGLRWEIYFPEKVNGAKRGGLLDLNTGLVRVAGVGGIGNNMNVENTFKNLAPRVGIAYQARPNTVIRMGFGRSFDIGTFGSIFGESVTENLPVVANQNLNASSAYTSVFNLQSGPADYVFPQIPANGLIPLPDGVAQRTRPTKMRLPTLDTWNATVQQQLAPSISLEIAYVGSKGTHNIYDDQTSYNANEVSEAGFTPGSQSALRRPFYSRYGWSQDITYFGNDANSHYNALQTKLDKRFTNGLQFLANYTFSSAKGHSASYFAIDPSVNYGPSTFNRRHNFVFFANYDLPFGRGKAYGSHLLGWQNELIGGFSVNGTLTRANGLPFTPSYNECGADIDNFNTGLCRPDKVNGGPTLKAGSFNATTHSVTYLSTVAPGSLSTNGAVSGPYGRPQVARFGNIGFNQQIGPGLFDSDMAVAKAFPLRESLELELRAEGYNVFNHPNYGNPNSCIDCDASQNPGQITGLLGGSNMRQLQFSARFKF